MIDKNADGMLQADDLVALYSEDLGKTAKDQRVVNDLTIQNHFFNTHVFYSQLTLLHHLKVPS